MEMKSEVKREGDVGGRGLGRKRLAYEMETGAKGRWKGKQRGEVRQEVLGKGRCWVLGEKDRQRDHEEKGRKICRETSMRPQ